MKTLFACGTALFVSTILVAPGPTVLAPICETTLSGADTAALAQLTLPEHPTKNEARDYVRRIMAISERQSEHSCNDPQIDMLLKVGPEHLDVVLEEMPDHDEGILSVYIPRVVERLAFQSNKAAVLAALRRDPYIADTVEEKHWTIDARSILLPALKEDRELPFQWISAVAQLQDPESYPGLIHQLLLGVMQSNDEDTKKLDPDLPKQIESSRLRSKLTIYWRIKDLPGISLNDGVEQIWSSIRFCEANAKYFAPAAARCGNVDALAILVAELDSKLLYCTPGCPHETRDFVTELTGMTLPNAELAKWFSSNRVHLKFNRDLHQFTAN